MTDGNRQVIEIAGVKLDVDMRTATRVDTLRVGDRVKVLLKTYSTWEAHHGVVVGFEPFKTLPTIVIAVAKVTYTSVELTFVHINAESKDVEVVKSVDEDQRDLPKDRVTAYFTDAIAKKREEIAELERKRDFFLREFGRYWERVEA